MKQSSRKVRIGQVIIWCEGVVLVKLDSDHEITLEDVQEQLAAAQDLTQGRPFVLVLDGGNTIDVKDEAMTFIARAKDPNWLAFAIIVRSLSERLFANYFLMFKKPVRPTKVFTTPAGAEKWLNGYMKVTRPLKYSV